MSVGSLEFSSGKAQIAKVSKCSGDVSSSSSSSLTLICKDGVFRLDQHHVA